MSFDAVVSPSALDGRICAVPSKSDLHRLLICSALADRSTRISVSGTNDDVEATISCLRSIGASIDVGSSRILVTPARPERDGCELDCGESGSTLRFIVPIVAALGIRRRVTGSGRLPSRPIGDLLGELSRHGAVLSSSSLPFTVEGPISPGVYEMPGDVSSQFITGLMFALPLLAGDSSIVLTSPLSSAGYVEMTISALRRFGVEIRDTDDGWSVPGGRAYRSPGDVVCEGDWSSAAFFLAAGAITGAGRSVSVSGLRGESPQGDKAVIDILRRFGADVVHDGDTATVSPGPLHGITIDAGDVPDLVPILAVVGACASGTTRITNASRLRLKESDRLEAMARALCAIGIECEERSDELIVRGGRMHGGAVECAGDHRIVMSMAIAACRCERPTTLIGAGACAKSYPNFFDDLRRLGGDHRVV